MTEQVSDAVGDSVGRETEEAVEDAVGDTTGEIMDDLRELQREGMGGGLGIPLPDSSMAQGMKDAVGDVVAEGGGNTIKSSSAIGLPEYDGTTTHGVLVLDDGTQIRFTYGNGHVEQKAALYMRKNNISDATVYHNNTNGTCCYCNTMTATFLPEGATLTVVPPKNAVANNSRAIDYVKTYTEQVMIRK